MIKKFTVFIAYSMLAAVISTPAHAMSEALKQCRYDNGIKMPPDECAVFQRVEVEAEARRAREEVDFAKNRALEAKLKQEREEKAAQEKQAYETQRAQEDAEREKRMAAAAADRAREDKANAELDRKAAAVTSARKATCGNDYLTPRIGMSIERAQQCVGRFKVTAQVNRADGVLTTYRGNRGYLHVMDGRVVSWGQY